MDDSILQLLNSNSFDSFDTKLWHSQRQAQVSRSNIFQKVVYSGVLVTTNKRWKKVLLLDSAERNLSHISLVDSRCSKKKFRQVASRCVLALVLTDEIMRNTDCNCAKAVKELHNIRTCKHTVPMKPAFVSVLHFVVQLRKDERARRDSRYQAALLNHKTKLSTSKTGNADDCRYTFSSSVF